MHHLDAQLAQAVKAVTDTLPAAQARQVQIRERAGVKTLRRLHQRDLHLRQVAAQIARCRGTAKTPSYHHHVGRCLARVHQCRCAQQQTASGHASHQLAAGNSGFQLPAHRFTSENQVARACSS